ncbi:hypothetical protein [Halorientalis salina]|uniref:hypothetical protein n=1 Tax=Halorientalis salina TaxID=2932266 RepID=UPI0010AD15B2|nr:hypothetical protein [Halorientalis salina]
MRQATEPTVDELLRALAHPHRRHLLEELRARRTAEGRNRVPLNAIHASLDVPEERARIECHHQHLPTLRAVGLIEDSDGGRTDGGADTGESARDAAVAPGPRFDRAVAVLDVLSEVDQRG